MKLALTFDDVQIVPKYSEIESRTLVNTRSMFTRRYSIGIPLVASPMDTVCDASMVLAMETLGGIGILHRWHLTKDERIRAIQTVKKQRIYGINSLFAAAIGVSKEEREIVKVLLDEGCGVLLIDVAHGHHKNVLNMMEFLNKRVDRSSFDVIIGSIATERAAKDVIEWGADALRVGVGGGSMCETRIRTGIGIPQLQSIIDVVGTSKWYGIPVIADGGIRTPGDVAKAIAAGANTVMIGSLFSGTDESPGRLFVTGAWPNQRTFKEYRGLASATTKQLLKGESTFVEGNSKLVEYKGSVANVVKDIMDGVKSCCSYVGANAVAELSSLSEFIQITQAGMIEASPHGL